MAGDFEGNPFADPEAINPFGDPAITRATEPSSAAGEDYNPFADSGGKQEMPGSKLPRLPPPPTKADIQAMPKQKQKALPKVQSEATSAATAIMEPNEDHPPVYTIGGAGPFGGGETGQLSKREEEIARREQALQERERNLQRLGPILRENNFPPFPKFCPTPFKPCFYLNINVDVPPPERWKMWLLLGLMLFTWVMLVLNMLASIVGASVAESSDRNEYLTTMGVSILYLVLFVPGTLFCWFMPAYYAYRKDSSLAFMWFFFVMLFQVLSYILNGIGAPTLGSCGFFNGAKLFGTSKKTIAAGTMYILLGVLWMAAAPMAGLLMFLVHRYYRLTGGSLDKATNEAVTGAAKNKAVRGVVKSGVAAGINSTM